VNRTASRLLKLVVIISSVAGLALSAPASAKDVTMQDVVRAADGGDYEAALEYLDALLEEDDPQSWGLLFHLFQSGDWGFEADKEVAQELFRRGLRQNYPLAHYYAALMLSPGPFSTNRPPPPQQYFTHLQNAAENGLISAQYILAHEYRRQKKYTQSHEWFKTAANNGDALSKAMTVLIEEVEHYPTTWNPDRLRGVESIGHPLIYEALAALYQFTPRSTNLNKSLALTYARLAEFFGNPYREKELKILLKGMTEKEIIKAEDKAEKWLWSWAHNRKTFLGEASAWCIDEGHQTISCISAAPNNHSTCRNPYLTFGFKNYQNFPAYRACRENLFNKQKQPPKHIE